MNMPASPALETARLGKRYGATWALRECTLRVPSGRVAALVGPNGAGKTTLLHLAVGLLRPTIGDISVCGYAPHKHPKQVLPHIGFVAQDHPLYASFTVAETLTLGRRLNPRWDDQLAHKRLERLGIPLNQRVGKLSGGQQAQVALVMALAKRPQFLLLDEPVASLDPLARRDFLRALTGGAAMDGVTVLLSSHIIGDLERVCDHLIILSASRVALTGDIAEIMRTHHLLTASRGAVVPVGAFTIVEDNSTTRQSILLVRGTPPNDPAWHIQEVTLEDIVLAYLGQSAGSAEALPPRAYAVPLTTEVSQ
jgi:ABC-2 type transport system ATP-binding protein